MQPTILLLTLALTLPPGRVPLEIDQLDKCVQKRFLDMRAFGMRRMAGPPPYHGDQNFTAENTEESTVLTQLYAKNYQVVFYLVGRGALQPASQSIPTWRSGVQGPLYITPRQNAPAPSEFLADARVALKSFDAGDGYSIRKTSGPS